jgi:hypothetical protein
MTIRHLDDEMLASEQRQRRLLIAFNVTLSPPPTSVVVTETGAPWFKWAGQFTNFDPTLRKWSPCARGASPQVAASVIKGAVGQANPGGVLILSVGHGFGRGTFKSNEGMFDLAPGGTFRIGGASAILPGKPPPKGKVICGRPRVEDCVDRVDAMVFYADPYPTRISLTRNGMNRTRAPTPRRDWTTGFNTRKFPPRSRTAASPAFSC